MWRRLARRTLHSGKNLQIGNILAKAVSVTIAGKRREFGAYARASADHQDDRPKACSQNPRRLNQLTVLSRRTQQMSATSVFRSSDLEVDFSSRGRKPSTTLV
jgi:hypothetical protein